MHQWARKGLVALLVPCPLSSSPSPFLRSIAYGQDREKDALYSNRGLGGNGRPTTSYLFPFLDHVAPEKWWDPPSLCSLASCEWATYKVHECNPTWELKDPISIYDPSFVPWAGLFCRCAWECQRNRGERPASQIRCHLWILLLMNPSIGNVAVATTWLSRTITNQWARYTLSHWGRSQYND